MSESVPLRAVLLGHGGMPEGVVDAVRHITGCEPDALVPISNRGMSPDSLSAEVQRVLGAGPGIIFTDLPSGSCGFVARRLTQHAADLVVISGVNLPLLLDFAMNRTLPLAELVPRLLSKGRAAMGCAPAHLEDHADRAASHR
ncbi:MAG: PTS sugar transporter subunit IIA [Longimicrobiales bacterium]